jgi:ABC-type Fe3+-hydroxamate transport system substrate-binding protein
VNPAPRRTRASGLLATFAVLLGAGCDRPTPDPPPARPDADRAVRRIVSLAPLATRFVIAIGAGDRLVALDADSADLSGAPALPTTVLDGVARHAADLVLVPALPDPGRAPLGARLVEFAPHDIEDALPLVRELGAELVGPEQATRFERAFSRPLARIGGESGGEPRPRVVAVVGLDPLEIAGGHSFETDLIEIAGGHSVTHPGEEHRLVIAADRWAELAPDLVWVVGPPPPSAREEQAVRNALPSGAQVAFFAFDPGFWIDASDEPARRLRGVIADVRRSAR